METYQSGKINLLSNSAVVTGIGTRFLNYIKPGDSFSVGAFITTVASVDSNTQLTLSSVNSGPDFYFSEYLITISTPPGEWYKFVSGVWTEYLPAPTVGSITIAPLLKSNLLSWIITDTQWPISLYSVEIWHNTVNDFNTASLLATVTTDTYRHNDLEVQTHYYWLRAVNSEKAITGATTAASQTPGAIVTKDISPQAVSINAFGATGDTVAGNGIGYQTVLSFTITNNADIDLPFNILHHCNQVYSGAAVTTAWVLVDTTINAVVNDWGSVVDKVHFVPLSAVYTIPAGATRVLAIGWYGANSTVSIHNRSFSFTALKV